MQTYATSSHQIAKGALVHADEQLRAVIRWEAISLGVYETDTPCYVYAERAKRRPSGCWTGSAPIVSDFYAAYDWYSALSRNCLIT